jgi:hypothetical protein
VAAAARKLRLAAQSSPLVQAVSGHEQAVRALVFVPVRTGTCTVADDRASPLRGLSKGMFRSRGCLFGQTIAPGKKHH